MSETSCDCQEQVLCRKCGKSIPGNKASHHLVRMGYAPSHFPYLKYEKWLLCKECLEVQLRVDKFEKVLASIGLAIVFFLMGLTFYLFFSA